ncbi:MAG: restriction endonuclease subunit S [Bacteroidales bacterium]
MNKIDKLILDYCPNGVDYVTIGSCVSKVQKIKWSEHSSDVYKYIDLSSVDRQTHIISDVEEITINNAPSRAQQIVEEGDILFGTTRPMLQRYTLIDKQYNQQICSTGFCVLRTNEDKLLSGWLYHQISSEAFLSYVEKNQKGASYPAISDLDIKRFKIPLPPLEIQQEIVRILDTMTNLTAELTAELTARKKQYEYYRDMLLNFGDDVEFMKLSEITSITRGTRVTKSQLNINGDYAVYQNSLGPMGYYDQFNFTKSKTYIITAGAAGEIGYSDEDFWAADDCLVIFDENGILNKFVYYYLLTKQQYISSNVRKASIPRLSRKIIENLPIPLPPLETQQKIVDILDRFDVYCNDITKGLPAEIEARQKQYEYYRNKLLTFKEL